MGTHLRVLSESYQMNTNMTGFGWFSKNFESGKKVASALEGLIWARSVIGWWEWKRVHTCYGDSEVPPGLPMLVVGLTGVVVTIVLVDRLDQQGIAVNLKPEIKQKQSLNNRHLA